MWRLPLLMSPPSLDDALLQGMTGDYKGLHGVTAGYEGLQAITKDYRKLVL